MIRNRKIFLTLPDALALATLVLEFEAETAELARGHSDSWARECREAVKLIRSHRNESQIEREYRTASQPNKSH
jgi:hypothetical protein